MLGSARRHMHDRLPYLLIMLFQVGRSAVGAATLAPTFAVRVG